jgi:hypothetical protein
MPRAFRSDESALSRLRAIVYATGQRLGTILDTAVSGDGGNRRVRVRPDQMTGIT